MRVWPCYRASFALILWVSPAIVAGESVGPETWAALDKTLGRAGKVFPGDVHKYGWPRTDLRVTVGGVQVEPTLALGSWAGLLKTSTEGDVMAMGDLVLLAEEVSPVVRALQVGGLDVLAIHNHLVGESPQVIYVHFGGHGEADQVAKALRGALEATKSQLTAPASPPSPRPSEIAAFEKIQTILGRKGSMVGRVLQLAVPRAGRIEEDGMEIPASLGMATALNFQLIDSRVATTGDFVLIAEEVNPVVRELESHGIQVTALHSHMLRETPRLFFMHFFGLDDPTRIAEGLKAALGRVAVALAIAGDPTKKDFETDAVGARPAGFDFTRTGNGADGKRVVRIETGADRNHVLVQESADPTDYRVLIAVLKEGSYEDVTLGVRARPLSGRVDHGGSAFKDAGKVGLWTKADSVIEFDDFTVEGPGR